MGDLTVSFVDGSVSEDDDRNSVGEDFEAGTKRLASRMKRKLRAHNA